MATITLNNAVYNDVIEYAESQNLSVDEFIAALINRFALTRKKRKKFQIKPIEELAPELQDILSMPRTGHIDEDDINGDQARMEYYKEKYNL